MLNETDCSNFEATLKVIAEVYNIRVVDLWNKTKIRRITEPRQVAIVFLRYRFKSTLQNSAEWFSLNHCIVCHSIKVFKNLFSVDTIFRERVNTIMLQTMTSDEMKMFISDVYAESDRSRNLKFQVMKKAVNP